MQRVQSRRRVRAHTGERKHTGRLAEQTTTCQNSESDLRSTFTNSDLSKTKQVVGAFEDRRICRPYEHETTEVLEYATGSGSTGHRCIPANMDETGYVFIPSMEIGASSVTTNQTTENSPSSANHAVLANTADGK
ncbi:hypothetical protein G6F43_014201 [Rhizopus delemar]|nr:hypothetical protein G6F43_014201 [Rhizopus delemar]